MNSSRLVVIGGGPAGREAARYSAHLGMDVTLVTRKIETGKHLDSASIRILAEEAARVNEAWGPVSPSPSPEFAPVLRETLIGALEITDRNYLSEYEGLRASGVRIVEGVGRLIGSDAVAVSFKNGGKEEITCSSIILATGIEPYGINASNIITLIPPMMPHIKDIPRSMIVLGSSPSALEVSLIFSAYGVDVTVVGSRCLLLNSLDTELRSIVVQAALEDNPIQLITEATTVLGTSCGEVDLLLSDNTHIGAECMLPCGEGCYRTADLGLEGPDVLTGADGAILTESTMRTNIPQIFAVGSITGCISANAAMEQARVAVSTIAGGNTAFRSSAVPNAIYFQPQIGTTGLTEQAAKSRRMQVTTSTIYKSPDEGPERWAKLVADESTGRIVGGQTIGDGAAEAAHLLALAVHGEITIGDLADLSCTSGTMAECISLASRLSTQPFPDSTRPIVDSP